MAIRPIRVQAARPLRRGSSRSFGTRRAANDNFGALPPDPPGPPANDNSVTLDEWKRAFKLYASLVVGEQVWHGDYYHSSSWGNLVDSILPFVPFFGPMTDLGDLLDDLMDPHKPMPGFGPVRPFNPWDYDGVMPFRNPDPWKVPAGWKVQHHCTTGPPSNWNGYVRGPRTNTTTSSNQCLSGQAIGGDPPGGELEFDLDSGLLKSGQWNLSGSTRFSSFWYQYDPSPAQEVRHKHWITYERSPNVTKPGASLEYQPWLFFPSALPFNPNVMRQMPGFPSSEIEYVVPPQEAIPEDWQASLTPAAEPFPRGHARRPPASYEREGKYMSKSARVGVAVYKALDEFSESAELVDSIYQALPKSVRQRWEKDRPKSRIGDQFGQYGLEGSDWKLQALWHNWHKVDLEQAIKNIIANHIEDKVIGAYSKHLPRNTVNAFAGGDSEAIVSKQLKKIFEFIGLE